MIRGYCVADLLSTAISKRPVSCAAYIGRIFMFVGITSGKFERKSYLESEWEAESKSSAPHSCFC